MAQINSKLGAKAATYGWYAQISSSNFDGSQLLAVKDDIVASGAVFVASVMPSVNFKEVTPEVAQQVAAAMKKFTDAGVMVWLRYAHEVNWYVKDGTYHGTSEDFVTSWKNIYEANCKDNDKVKCYWSPNQEGDMKNLEPFWPGPEYVDLVGIDCYPKSGDDTSGNDLFDRLYGDFYKTYSEPYDLPFAIGETGAGPGQKEGWLKQLVSQDKSKYPNYVSMSWFEFDKEADFRIVMTDDSTLQQTKEILLSGSDGSCSGGSGGSTPGNGTVPMENPPPQSATRTPTATGGPAATGGPGLVLESTDESNCSWG